MPTMSNVKFTRLGEHPEPPARRPCLMFVGIVGSMIFFVLYLTYSADMATNQGSYEVFTATKLHLNNTTVAPAHSSNVTVSIGNSTNGNTKAPTSANRSSTGTPTKSSTIKSTMSNNSNETSSTEKLTTRNSTMDSKNEISTSLSTPDPLLRLDNPSIPKVENTSKVFDTYALYTPKCRIRNYDFNEAAMKKKYFTNQPKMCPKDSKPFIFIANLNKTAGHSCIGLDEAVAKKHHSNWKNWSCTYMDIMRDTGYSVIDRHYKFGPKVKLNVGDCPPKIEFLWIECNLTGKSEKLYEQPLILPMVRGVKHPVYPNNIGKKPLNVLVVGLDSVSRLNAHRQFPKTLEFLQKKKNLVELFGYNKIGLNSAPNQIPLLSGVNYRDGPTPGMSERVSGKYFDNLTRYLWDDFSDKGFRTMFYEEQWVYGLFLYSSLNGFKEIPTTYWPRPVMQAIDRSKLKEKGSGGWCIGPDFPAKHYLDYTLNTMKILGEDRPLFSYSWLSETAHDDVNGGHRVDGYFLDFFTRMENDGVLNNTAVFFISDHGFRFGAFRKTKLGGYEDMLPYGFILLPDSYYETNPEALEILKINSRRLVTVYDLHATLLELSDPWSEARTIRTSNGFSLLSTVVPEDRNCADADINFQFCSCFEPQPYDRNGPYAKAFSAFVLDTVNGKLTTNNATSKCHHWEVASIDDFSRLSEGDHWTNYFKISLKMKPDAQFEATAEFLEAKQSWKLLAEVDRTDWFSSHAKCVKGSSYERFCYCKK